MTTPSRKRNVSLAAAEESAATTERALGAEATAAAASVSGELLADERYLRLQCETERMKKKNKKKKIVRSEYPGSDHCRAGGTDGRHRAPATRRTLVTRMRSLSASPLRGLALLLLIASS